MKDVYLLFQNHKPKSSEETLNLIAHFCREHSLDYSVPQTPGSMVVKIDGGNYYVYLHEKKEEPGSSYWMISCILNNDPLVLKHIA